ncbi:hypothetical protein MML48_1g15756 [Holotrichia oblita]|uniref:Uncharacterized protein n=1 Tax=Holotrichia oblita TaxID=644536 RepID=A0ACB9TW27_HOLOL|nr:hypothetical protein MML48_1g15756 [Holotrichia oblita]
MPRSAGKELAEKPELCILSDSSSSSDSDSDWYKLEGTRQKRTRILNYVDTTVPKYLFAEFRQHFPVSTEIVEMLTGKYANNVSKNYAGGWPEVSHRKAVLIGLWYLSNTETYRQISDRFDISLSTAHEVVGLFADCLLKCKTLYIKWPSQNEAQNISHTFERRGGFRNTLGSIDGCHFRIKKPICDGDDYINRKVYHSIILQGVVDYKKLFIDMSVGYPGSLHYARSDFGEDFIEIVEDMEDEDTNCTGKNNRR